MSLQTPWYDRDGTIMTFDPESMGAQKSERKRPTDPLIGTLVNGKFRIEKAIARGGMGRIYYGTQAPLDRPVAVKVVKADTVSEEDSQFLKRFLLEASILAKLQHPNVVTLFDYGRIENAPNGQEMYFIAMEYLDGETLSDRLRNNGNLAAYETLLLFRQIARGLREAHSRGVIHRDLKPSNIIIVPEADGAEIVKLVDFGIGKAAREGEDLTRDGLLVGTPKYMAPEQFDGSASPASDIYALGIIIYQLLTGEVPFQGNTMAEYMIAKLQNPITPMHQVNPICDSTELLESLVYGMLARLPADRPSLEEVFNYLARCEEEVFGSNGARLAHSGSISRPNVGNPISSRNTSIGALKVPYTIVAPQPMRPGSTGSGISAVQLNQLTGATGATQSAMSTSHPPAPGKRAFPLPALLAIVFALVSIGGTGIWLARTRLSAKTPEASSASANASTPVPATIAPAEVTSFVLHLESSPSGAVVSEEGNVLGTTPIDIKIERASVKAAQRSFQLRKDGFTTTIYAQKDADSRVEQTVTLSADPAKPGKTPHAGNGKPATSPGGKPQPAASGPDIRLQR
ncbi:MAG: serine/threonine-protein kinase [Labilithrix sp.]